MANIDLDKQVSLINALRKKLEAPTNRCNRESLLHVLYEQQMALVTACAATATAKLFRGKSSWSEASLLSPPAHSEVQEALKLCGVAQLILDDATVKEYEAAWEGQPLLDLSCPCLKPDAHESFVQNLSSSRCAEKVPHASLEKGASLKKVWPRVRVFAAIAAAYYMQRRPRLAVEYSAAAVAQLRSASPHDPESLPLVAFHEFGTRGAGEQVISVFSSHAAILHRLERDAEALPFAQLACVMTRNFGDQLMWRAANDMCQELNHTCSDEREVEVNVDQHGHSSVDLSVLQGRSALPLLLALCIYNCTVIMESVSSATTVDQRSRLLSLAVQSAQGELPRTHPFVKDLLRRQELLLRNTTSSQQLQPLPAPRTCTLKEVRVLQAKSAANSMEKVPFTQFSKPQLTNEDSGDHWISALELFP